MTIGLSAGATGDLDNWFDRYVTGSKAANCGISVGGTDLSQIYQAIAAGGSQGANTGIRYGSGQADIATLFSAKGTTPTNSPLPINGKTYSGGMIVSSGSGTIGYTFNTNASTWNVLLSRAGGSGSPAAGTQDTGSVPSGATSCRLTLTYVSGTTCTTSNNAASALALSSTPSASITSPSILQNNPGSQTDYSLKIEYLNSSNAVISTTNIAFAPSWSGNV